jgi:hypothetical protein
MFDQMKRRKWMLTGLAAIALAVSGCTKTSQVDTTALQASYKSADAPAQAIVNKVVAAVKAGDAQTAMQQLHVLRETGTTTAEQTKAVMELMAKVKKSSK